MKCFSGLFKRYGFDFCLFVLLILTLMMSYARYYFMEMFLFDEDGVMMEVSTFYFIKECLGNGEYPLWNKYLSAGMPVAGNISMRCFYLPNYLLAFLPLKQAIYCDYIMHVAVGAMFFYLLLKQIGCRRGIAAVMAFVYQFSINLGGIRKRHGPIIFTAIYLPIIIYFIEKYLKTEKLKWLIYAAIAMALQFCGGFTQCILYSDIFVGIYLVVGILKRGVVGRKPGEIIKWIKHLFIWFGSYFGLIAIQLVPFLELLKENSVYDKSPNSYEFFSSYSLHPIKLLQMIFPKIFIDEYFSFGESYSSGIDIELYMGPAIILLLICGVIIYRKEYRIRAYCIASFLVFCWASIGCFPFIARIVNKMPLIGGTRAQARIIFIFCFLILLMVGYIGELVVRRGDYQKLLDMAKLIVSGILIFVVTAFAGAFAYAGAQGFGNEARNLAVYFKTSYYKDIILYLLCLLTLFCLCRNEQKRNGKNRYIFLAALLVINMVGVLPYSLQTRSISIDDTLGTNNLQDDFLKANIENYKVWDDFTSMDGQHQSNISQNKSVIKKIAAINSYTNFSNPRVYIMMSRCDNAPLNYSGLLTGNTLAGQNLRTRNDMLSMLGIKYIIDSEGFLESNTETYTFGDEKQEIMYLEKVEGEVTAGNLYVFNSAIILKPRTIYRITFCGSAMSDERMYCDFYGEQYDNNEQQYEFTLADKKKIYETYIFSGEKVPEQTVFRFVCPNVSSEIMIEDVCVTEMETYSTDSYQLVSSGRDYEIYENLNANNILYFSNTLKLPDKYNIYDATGLGFNENSYIEDGTELSNTSLNKYITDIDFGVNRISANIYTDENSFINFSQTYFPGWKAYVDGIEQKVFTVNGVIMGTYVPIGNHVVEFCYRPLSVIIGIAISSMTIVMLILKGIWDSYRKKFLNQISH